MKNGDKAALIQPEISGVIINTQYNNETNELEHELEYPDENGETQVRLFPASKLKEVK